MITNVNFVVKSYADRLKGRLKSLSNMLLVCLACCVVAARAAPTSLHRLSESELDGYCRRRLDGDAPLINGGEGLEPAPANGTRNVMGSTPTPMRSSSR